MIQIHGKKIHIEYDEFPIRNSPEFFPMQIREDVGKLDRVIAFLNKIAKGKVLFCHNITHGGYVPLGCVNFLEKHVTTNSPNVFKNNDGSIVIHDEYDDYSHTGKHCVLYTDTITEEMLYKDYDYILSSSDCDSQKYNKLRWFDYFIYVNLDLWKTFTIYFGRYINEDEFTFDNLVNLLFMVKNSGDGFREVLEKNLPYADNLTILDTGSTDNTVKIIRDFLKHNPGSLYEEPFLNFRDSRNRLFDLAGKDYAFNIMLDDTYILTGPIRDFLNIARGDDVADSFSMFINGGDTKYGSVRVTKPRNNPRYKYRIHEVVDSLLPMMIPEKYGTIYDLVSPYMNKRTYERKRYDLEMLFADREEYSDDPRILYYIAETYLCMHNFEKAAEYYALRSNEEGYTEEKYDSLYKYAVLHHMNLGTPWEKCHQYYLKAFEYEPRRPESLFMIGYENSKRGNYNTSYIYLKQAFEIGIPSSKVFNMNLKFLQYNYHLPMELAKVAFLCKKYNVSEKAISRLLEYNSNDPHGTMWKNMLRLLKHNEPYRSRIKKYYTERKLVCMVMDGGWEDWNGETLRSKGLGGSETFIIQTSEIINQKYPEFHVVIFCKCSKQVEYNGVTYLPISSFIEFVSTFHIYRAVVHRYTEIVPIATENLVPTTLVLHDLNRPGDVIIPSPFLMNITCFTDWHKNYFTMAYPEFSDRTSVISHGLNLDEYRPSERKIPYSFIYSSFPTRGLLLLLKLFPKITERYPDAHLNIFCDMEHTWSNQVDPEMMKECKILIEQQQKNVTNHGWVNGETLRKYWATTQIWFYPTHFHETFCVTALEAAASKTLVIAPDIGGLSQTVGNRGILISGAVHTEEWQNRALQNIYSVLDNPELYHEYTDQNYEWSRTKSWEVVTEKFVNLVLTLESE